MSRGERKAVVTVLLYSSQLQQSFIQL